MEVPYAAAAALDRPPGQMDEGLAKMESWFALPPTSATGWNNAPGPSALGPLNNPSPAKHFSPPTLMHQQDAHSNWDPSAGSFAFPDIMGSRTPDQSGEPSPRMSRQQSNTDDFLGPYPGAVYPSPQQETRPPAFVDLAQSAINGPAQHPPPLYMSPQGAHADAFSALQPAAAQHSSLQPAQQQPFLVNSAAVEGLGTRDVYAGDVQPQPYSSPYPDSKQGQASIAPAFQEYPEPAYNNAAQQRWYDAGVQPVLVAQDDVILPPPTTSHSPQFGPGTPRMDIEPYPQLPSDRQASDAIAGGAPSAYRVASPRAVDEFQPPPLLMDRGSPSVVYQYRDSPQQYSSAPQADYLPPGAVQAAVPSSPTVHPQLERALGQVGWNPSVGQPGVSYDSQPWRVGVDDIQPPPTSFTPHGGWQSREDPGVEVQGYEFQSTGLRRSRSMPQFGSNIGPEYYADVPVLPDQAGWGSRDARQDGYLQYPDAGASPRVFAWSDVPQAGVQGDHPASSWQQGQAVERGQWERADSSAMHAVPGFEAAQYNQAGPPPQQYNTGYEPRGYNEAGPSQQQYNTGYESRGYNEAGPSQQQYGMGYDSGRYGDTGPLQQPYNTGLDSAAPYGTAAYPLPGANPIETNYRDTYTRNEYSQQQQSMAPPGSPYATRPAWQESPAAQAISQQPGSPYGPGPAWQEAPAALAMSPRQQREWPELPPDWSSAPSAAPLQAPSVYPYGDGGGLASQQQYDTPPGAFAPQYTAEGVAAQPVSNRLDAQANQDLGYGAAGLAAVAGIGLGAGAGYGATSALQQAGGANTEQPGDYTQPHMTDVRTDVYYPQTVGVDPGQAAVVNSQPAVAYDHGAAGISPMQAPEGMDPSQTLTASQPVTVSDLGLQPVTYDAALDHGPQVPAPAGQYDSTVARDAVVNSYDVPADMPSTSAPGYEVSSGMPILSPVGAGPAAMPDQGVPVSHAQGGPLDVQVVAAPEQLVQPGVDADVQQRDFDQQQPVAAAQDLLQDPYTQQAAFDLQQGVFDQQQPVTAAQDPYTQQAAFDQQQGVFDQQQPLTAAQDPYTQQAAFDQQQGAFDQQQPLTAAQDPYTQQAAFDQQQGVFDQQQPLTAAQDPYTQQAAFDQQQGVFDQQQPLTTAQDPYTQQAAFDQQQPVVGLQDAYVQGGVFDQQQPLTAAQDPYTQQGAFDQQQPVTATQDPYTQDSVFDQQQPIGDAQLAGTAWADPITQHSDGQDSRAGFQHLEVSDSVENQPPLPSIPDTQAWQHEPSVTGTHTGMAGMNEPFTQDAYGAERDVQLDTAPYGQPFEQPAEGLLGYDMSQPGTSMHGHDDYTSATLEQGQVYDGRDQEDAGGLPLLSAVQPVPESDGFPNAEPAHNAGYPGEAMADHNLQPFQDGAYNAEPELSGLHQNDDRAYGTGGEQGELGYVDSVFHGEPQNGGGIQGVDQAYDNTAAEGGDPHYGEMPRAQEYGEEFSAQPPLDLNNPPSQLGYDSYMSPGAGLDAQEITPHPDTYGDPYTADDIHPTAFAAGSNPYDQDTPGLPPAADPTGPYPTSAGAGYNGESMPVTYDTLPADYAASPADYSTNPSAMAPGPADYTMNPGDLNASLAGDQYGSYTGTATDGPYQAVDPRTGMSPSSPGDCSGGQVAGAALAGAAVGALAAGGAAAALAGHPHAPDAVHDINAQSYGAGGPVPDPNMYGYNPGDMQQLQLPADAAQLPVPDPSAYGYNGVGGAPMQTAATDAALPLAADPRYGGASYPASSGGPVPAGADAVYVGPSAFDGQSAYDGRAAQTDGPYVAPAPPVYAAPAVAALAVPAAATYATQIAPAYAAAYPPMPVAPAMMGGAPARMAPMRPGQGAYPPVAGPMAPPLPVRPAVAPLAPAAAGAVLGGAAGAAAAGAGVAALAGAGASGRGNEMGAPIGGNEPSTIAGSVAGFQQMNSAGLSDGVGPRAAPLDALGPPPPFYPDPSNDSLVGHLSVPRPDVLNAASHPGTPAASYPTPSPFATPSVQGSERSARSAARAAGAPSPAAVAAGMAPLTATTLAAHQHSSSQSLASNSRPGSRMAPGSVAALSPRSGAPSAGKGSHYLPASQPGNLQQSERDTWSAVSSHQGPGSTWSTASQTGGRQAPGSLKPSQSVHSAAGLSATVSKMLPASSSANLASSRPGTARSHASRVTTASIAAPDGNRTSATANNVQSLNIWGPGIRKGQHAEQMAQSNASTSHSRPASIAGSKKGDVSRPTSPLQSVRSQAADQTASQTIPGAPWASGPARPPPSDHTSRSGASPAPSVAATPRSTASKSARSAAPPSPTPSMKQPPQWMQPFMNTPRSAVSEIQPASSVAGSARARSIAAPGSVRAESIVRPGSVARSASMPPPGQSPGAGYLSPVLPQWLQAARNAVTPSPAPKLTRPPTPRARSEIDPTSPRGAAFGSWREQAHSISKPKVVMPAAAPKSVPPKPITPKAATVAPSVASPSAPPAPKPLIRIPVLEPVVPESSPPVSVRSAPMSASVSLPRTPTKNNTKHTRRTQSLSTAPITNWFAPRPNPASPRSKTPEPTTWRAAAHVHNKDAQPSSNSVSWRQDAQQLKAVAPNAVSILSRPPSSPSTKTALTLFSVPVPSPRSKVASPRPSPATPRASAPATAALSPRQLTPIRALPPLKVPKPATAMSTTKSPRPAPSPRPRSAPKPRPSPRQAAPQSPPVMKAPPSPKVTAAPKRSSTANAKSSSTAPKLATKSKSKTPSPRRPSRSASFAAPYTTPVTNLGLLSPYAQSPKQSHRSKSMTMSADFSRQYLAPEQFNGWGAAVQPRSVLLSRVSTADRTSMPAAVTANDFAGARARPLPQPLVPTLLPPPALAHGCTCRGDPRCVMCMHKQAMGSNSVALLSAAPHWPPNITTYTPSAPLPTARV